jgi:hypothetical protein
MSLCSIQTRMNIHAPKQPVVRFGKFLEEYVSKGCVWSVCGRGVTVLNG